jgi:uncharacterized protein YjbI with pentapeptide repeats
MTATKLLEKYSTGERDFSFVSLTGLVNFAGECLIDINFSHANLSEARLSGADLSWANLTGADLSQTDLNKAVLIETNLSGADLTGANTKDILFCRTIMPYGDIKSDRTRVITTQQLLERYEKGDRRFPGVVIPRADLRDRDLRGINLSHREVMKILKYPPYLPYANLSGANLEESNLRGVNLRGANLSGANLSDAILKGANLTNANLRGANLFRTNIEGVNFTGADLTGAEIIENCLYWLTFFHNTTLPNGEIIVGPISYSD